MDRIAHTYAGAHTHTHTHWQRWRRRIQRAGTKQKSDTPWQRKSREGESTMKCWAKEGVIKSSGTSKDDGCGRLHLGAAKINRIYRQRERERETKWEKERMRAQAAAEAQQSAERATRYAMDIER